MHINRFLDILKMPESEKLDFKEKLNLDNESGKKEFVRDVLAMANAKGGRGYIIFGVKDKTKEILGISPKVFDEERMQQILSNRSDPPVPIRVDFVSVSGKTAAVVTIFRSEQRPHQMVQTGAFYTRRGSTTDLAKRHEIAAMFQENGMLSYENTVLRDAATEDLDLHLSRRLSGRQLSQEPENALFLLEGLGILKKADGRLPYRPTVGGMLLMGKTPQKFLPSTGIFLDCKGIHYSIQGAIPHMLEEAQDKIKNILAGTNYPLVPILEGIYNACIHRDYLDIYREIAVEISDKTITVTNPGALWQDNRIRALGNDGAPPRRNPWLYQRMLLFYMRQERINTTGIQDMKQFFPDKAIKFINLKRQNLFKLVLPGIAEWKN